MSVVLFCTLLEANLWVRLADELMSVPSLADPILLVLWKLLVERRCLFRDGDMQESSCRAELSRMKFASPSSILSGIDSGTVSILSTF